MKRFPQTLAALAVAAACLAPAAIAESTPAGQAPGAGRAGEGQHEGRGGHGKGHHGRRPFEQLDTDKSGGISLDELKAAWAQNPRRLEHAPKAFGHMDANKDNKIDKAEWEAKRKWGKGEGRPWKRDGDGKDQGGDD